MRSVSVLVRKREVTLFLLIGGSVAVLGHALLVLLIGLGVAPGVANAVQIVVTLQLSFVAHDVLTWRWRRHERRARPAEPVVAVPGGPQCQRGTEPGRFFRCWRRWSARPRRIGVCSAAGRSPTSAQTGSGRSPTDPEATQVDPWRLLPLLTAHVTVLPSGWRPALAVVVVLVGAAAVFVDAFLVVVSLFMLLVAVTTLAFQLYKWWRPQNNDPGRYGDPDAPELPGVILVPMRHEEAVAGQTLERLANLDHPAYRVMPIIDHPDDPGTAAIAHAKAAEYPDRVVVAPYPEDTDVHNKPIGLNAAVRLLEEMEIDYEWIGIADAEDLFHPGFAAHGRLPVPPHRCGHRAMRRAADELQCPPEPDADARWSVAAAAALAAGQRVRVVARGQRAGVLQVVPVAAQAAGRRQGDAVGRQHRVRGPGGRGGREPQRGEGEGAAQAARAASGRRGDARGSEAGAQRRQPHGRERAGAPGTRERAGADDTGGGRPGGDADARGRDASAPPRGAGARGAGDPRGGAPAPRRAGRAPGPPRRGCRAACRGVKIFRRPFLDALRTRHGASWDEDCLTEDCKIGIVASVLGFSVDVVYIDDMVTREETPDTLGGLVRQRVRWMQGFIQVFTEREWLELPRPWQKVLAVYVLGFQFFQAFAIVFAPFALAIALWHKSPIAVALLACLPLGLSLLTIALDLLMLHQFGRTFEQKVRLRDYLGVAVGAYPYQFVLSVAGLWALLRHLRGRNNWVKTAHSGAHLTTAPDATPARQARRRRRSRPHDRRNHAGRPRPPQQDPGAVVAPPDPARRSGVDQAASDQPGGRAAAAGRRRDGARPRHGARSRGTSTTPGPTCRRPGPCSTSTGSRRTPTSTTTPRRGGSRSPPGRRSPTASTGTTRRSVSATSAC